MLVEFFTGQALFQTHENLEHLAMMEAVFGPMPDRFARHARLVVRFHAALDGVDSPGVPQPVEARLFQRYQGGLSELLDVQPVPKVRQGYEAA